MFYRALELTLSPALRGVFKPEVTGFDHVPPRGPVVLAANHLSFVDEFFTPIAVRRQVTYLAKAEYFDTPGPRGWAMKAFFGSLGHVPVDRDSTRAAAASIDICVDVLSQGRAFGIYPEGTRSPDGRLYKFRTGVARVALRSGAPVVPVGLVGTREVQPPGARMWRRAPLAVHFGPPMYFGHLADSERSSKVLREVTETIREAVQKLSGQEYVDTYASAAKEV
ncbi:MAG TPA: lysophospholipid acyltransferase family protein [Jatrophihabitans sp.]